MEGRGSGREGAGGSRQELEESQWRRHCGREQSGAEGYTEDPGGEYERWKDHHWRERSDTAEQLDAGAVTRLGLLQDAVGIETVCGSVQGGEPVEHGNVGIDRGRGAGR